jgi:pyruvate/2-oxoglutarate dehydrogenase complex dihydrolipoamide dehydrogenase (E3) component
MALRSYDVVIIGGGQAGIPLAFELAVAGHQVALAERKQLGGSCVNFGCTPTKAAIASAKLAHQARRAQEYGLRIPTVDVDFKAVLDRANALAARSRDSLTHRFKESKNPVLLEGHASFDGRDGERLRVRVGDQTVLARHVVLDTGTRSLIPPLPGLEEVDYLHASNWLDRSELPGHLAVIGGGYIGLEMGQMYRRFGSEVTIIDQAAQIAGHEDEDVAEALQTILESEGIRFLLRTGVSRVEVSPGGVRLDLAGPQGERLEATHLFIATARKPNTDALALGTIGLEANERGIIEVNERLATKVPGVWAVGDIRGGPMFTHTAWDDYRIVFSQLAGDGRRTTDRVVPYALFTDPELGRVGMTEEQARQAGKSIRVGRFEMKANGKARELGETQGFIKVIVEAGTHQILGAAVLAADGAELVHLYVDLMNAKAPYQVLENAVHIHPTLAEAVQSAVSDLPETIDQRMPNVQSVK